MLLADLSNELLSEFKKKEDILAKQFYERLCRNEFDIFFTYIQESSSLLYEALAKDSDEYCGMFISLDRSLSSFEEDTRIYAFARYIYEQEHHLSKEELANKYQMIPALDSLASLSIEDAAEKKEMLPLLKELSSSLLTSLQSDQNIKRDKLGISYEILSEPYAENEFFLRLHIHEQKRQEIISSPFDFLSKAINSGMVSLFKENVLLVSNRFADFDLKVFNFLLNNGIDIRYTPKNYLGIKGAIAFKNDAVVDFFFMLLGKTINFDHEACEIDSFVQDVKFSLLDDGNMYVEPTPYGSFISAGLHGLLIHPKRRKISLLRFSSRKELTLYRFICQHPTFRFDLFKNEMATDILPLFDESLDVSEQFKEHYKVRKEEIRYYLTYTDNDAVEITTKFFNDTLEVTKEVFISHPIGKAKYYEFINQLNNMFLQEEDYIRDQERILSLLRMDFSPLQNCATLFFSDNLLGRKVRGVGKVNLRMKSNIDWLNLELGSDVFSDAELDMILSAYKKKKKYVKLKDQFVSFEDQESQNFIELVNDFAFDKRAKDKVPIYTALKLSSYADDEVHIQYSKEVESLFLSIKNFKNLNLDLADDIKSYLRGYQIDGVKWLKTLADLHLSGILADDMGLGKTLEVIALLSLSKEEKPILIASPKSLIYNWENEFKKWNPKQSVSVIDGMKNIRRETISQIDNNKKVVYIVSYDSLRNDLADFGKNSFSYFILDEGQNIANVYAKKTRAVKEIEAEHKFVLTGTPIQNSLMDLWSIFDFLMPGYLSSYQAFYHQYGKLALTDREERDVLMKKVMPFILKRTKSEVLKELPPKEEVVLTVSMSDQQRKLYDAYLQRARNAIDEGKNKITILAEITRLREICVDPTIFLENFDSLSEKLAMAISTIKNGIGNGHKLLVFSTFARTLMHLQECLNQENIPTYFIYGDTPAKDRLMMADDFNEKDDVKVMLVSLKAGGTGLNLVGADLVLHLDPWWNLAAENQASDRAHRIGQKRAVTVLKMICKDSIEERVIELQERKKELSQVITEGEEGITSFDINDLKFLLEDN